MTSRILQAFLAVDAGFGLLTNNGDMCQGTCFAPANTHVAGFAQVPIYYSV